MFIAQLTCVDSPYFRDTQLMFWIKPQMQYGGTIKNVGNWWYNKSDMCFNWRSP